MHYVDAKGILSAQNGMNVYRGCSHGCIYCDSRSRCYNINHPFEDIEVKQNAPELLEKTLRSKRNKCMIGTGSMSDPYIHLENELQITRKCLELIDKYEFGVAIQTKSNRILRDIDLLDSINQKAKAVVQVTLTTYDDELCKKLEPNVCVTSERVEILRECQKRGIPTVVWICPTLPFINDTRENLEGLLRFCVEVGVKGIITFGIGVTLRDGDREYFYEHLDKNFPGMKSRYIQAFGNSYECLSPRAKELESLIEETCKKHNIMYNPDDIFKYMREYPAKYAQGSIFDFF